MLAYKNRFHGHNSLSYVYRKGTALRGSAVVVRYVKNPRRNEPRIAVVVSKKVYKGAVGRNRIRRRIYEWFRQQLPSLPPNYDIVCVVTTAEIRTMSSTELGSQLTQVTAPLLDKNTTR